MQIAMRVGFLLAMQVVHFVPSSTFNYCQFNCEKHRHTVCLGNHTCLPKDCIPIRQTYEWRKGMLEAHNYYRNNVAIGNDTRGGNSMSSNMRALSYDMELETISYCWATRCKYGYDQCRKTLRFIAVGQNIYKGLATDKIFVTPWRIVKSWYRQIVITNYSLIDHFSIDRRFYRRYRHFTQLVNAKTTHMGCAEVNSKAYESPMIVCNYGPRGNLAGRSVYWRGAPATRCPIGLKRNKKFKGLCGEVYMPIETYRKGVILPSAGVEIFSHARCVFGILSCYLLPVVLRLNKI